MADPVYWNAQAENIFGWPRDEVLGRNPSGNAPLLVTNARLFWKPPALPMPWIGGGGTTPLGLVTGAVDVPRADIDRDSWDGIVAFARAIGEYGSVIFIAGNMPMVSEITPLIIIGKLEQYDYAGATAVAVVMLVFSFILLLIINALQAWQRRHSGAPV